LNNWIPFTLDVPEKDFHKRITSAEMWRKMVATVFQWDTNSLLALKSYGGIKGPDFGTSSHHNTNPTLGEWAEENHIDLSVVE